MKHIPILEMSSLQVPSLISLVLIAVFYIVLSYFYLSFAKYNISRKERTLFCPSALKGRLDIMGILMGPTSLKSKSLSKCPFHGPPITLTKVISAIGLK